MHQFLMSSGLSLSFGGATSARLIVDPLLVDPLQLLCRVGSLLCRFALITTTLLIRRVCLCGLVWGLRVALMELLERPGMVLFFFLNTTLLAAFRGHPVDCHTTDY